MVRATYQDVGQVLLAGLQGLPQGAVAVAVSQVQLGPSPTQRLHNHRQVARYGPLQGTQLVRRPARGTTQSTCMEICKGDNHVNFVT